MFLLINQVWEITRIPWLIRVPDGQHVFGSQLAAPNDISHQQHDTWGKTHSCHNSHAEALAPNVTEYGGGAFGWYFSVDEE